MQWLGAAAALALVALAGCAPSSSSTHHDLQSYGILSVSYDGSMAKTITWHWSSDGAALHFKVTTFDGTTERTPVEQTTLQGTGSAACGVRCSITWQNPDARPVGFWESSTAGGVTTSG